MCSISQRLPIDLFSSGDLPEERKICAAWGLADIRAGKGGGNAEGGKINMFVKIVLPDLSARMLLPAKLLQCTKRPQVYPWIAEKALLPK